MLFASDFARLLLLDHLCYALNGRLLNERKERKGTRLLSCSTVFFSVLVDDIFVHMVPLSIVFLTFILFFSSSSALEVAFCSFGTRSYSRLPRSIDPLSDLSHFLLFFLVVSRFACICCSAHTSQDITVFL